MEEYPLVMACMGRIVRFDPESGALLELGYAAGPALLCSGSLYWSGMLS